MNYEAKNTFIIKSNEYVYLKVSTKTDIFLIAHLGLTFFCIFILFNLAQKL